MKNQRMKLTKRETYTSYLFAEITYRLNLIIKIDIRSILILI